MLQLEKVCKAIGFTAEQIGKLLTGKPLSFSGSMYSEEHKQKLNTDSYTAKIAQDIENNNLHLIVDGKYVSDWFKQKYKEFRQSISQRQEPVKRKGMKL